MCRRWDRFMAQVNYYEMRRFALIDSTLFSSYLFNLLFFIIPFIIFGQMYIQHEYFTNGVLLCYRFNKC